MDHAASILGLDIGSVRIGVSKALWPDGIPSSLTVIKNDKDLSSTLKQLIENENVKCIVAGRPRSLSGDNTEQTKYTLELVDQLGNELPVKIFLQDEAGTSIKAEDELRKRKRPYAKEDIDSLSAVYILEDFINSHPSGRGIDA